MRRALRDIDRLLVGQRPRQLDQPVEIGAHHAVFGRGLGHALEAAQLLARLVLDLLRHLRLADRRGELRDLGALAVAFAELALDRGHLLAQQHLALAFVERGLGLLADLVRQPQDLDPSRQQPRHPIEPGDDVDGFQDLLLLFRLEVHIGRDQIGELAGRADRLDGGDHLRRRLRHELQRLHRLPLQIEEARLDLGRAHVGLLDALDAGEHERPAAEEVRGAEALLALAHEMVRAVRGGDVADDVGDRADAVEVDRARVGRLGVALHENADLALSAHRFLDGGDRTRPAHGDGKHHAGEQHGLAHRHDDQRIGAADSGTAALVSDARAVC